MDATSDQTHSAWWKPLLKYIPLIAVPLLSFGISLGGYFVLDDKPDLLTHPVVQGEAPIWELTHYNYMGNPIGTGPNTWRPWPTFTYWLQWNLFGSQAFLYRAWMLVLHITTVVASYKVLGEYVPKRAAYIAALLFAGLGIHSSVLVSAAHSPDVWALLFSLGALWATNKEKPVLSALAVLLACFSKESAILLPALLGIAAWVNGRSWRSPASAAAIALAFLGTRALLLPLDPTGHVMTLDNPIMLADFPTHVWMVFVILGTYIFKTFVPIELAYDYTYNAIPTILDLTNPMGWIGIGFVILCISASLLARKSPAALKQTVLIAVGFGAGYGVISNVFPIVVIFAERLFYGPSFWLMLGFGLALNTAFERRRSLTYLGIATIVLTQIPLAAFNTYAWRGNIPMGIRQIVNAPGSAAAQMTLAQALSERGQHDVALWHMAVASSAVSAYPDPTWSPPEETKYGDVLAMADALEPNLPPGQVLAGFRQVVADALVPDTLARYDYLVAQAPKEALWPPTGTSPKP